MHCYTHYIRHTRTVNPTENSCGYLTEKVPFPEEHCNSFDGVTELVALRLVNEWNDAAIRYMAEQVQYTFSLPT